MLGKANSLIANSNSVSTYCWGKFTYTADTVENPQIVFTKNGSSGKSMKLSSASFDVSKITDYNYVDIFDGFSYTNSAKNSFRFYKEGLKLMFELKYYNTTSTYTYECTYTVSSQNLEATSVSAGIYTYTGVKQLGVPILNFEGFVSSDREDEYPDGAVHTDGYYYQKCPKRYVTKSGSAYAVSAGDGVSYHYKVPHGLGVTPTVAGVTYASMYFNYNSGTLNVYKKDSEYLYIDVLSLGDSRLVSYAVAYIEK